jgi:hypothetical protein
VHCSERRRVSVRSFDGVRVKSQRKTGNERKGKEKGGEKKRQRGRRKRRSAQWWPG